MALDKADAQLIAEAIAKQSKTSTTPTTQLPTAPVNLFGKAIDSAKGGLDTLGKAYKELETEINLGKSTFRDFSKTGISFGNDIIGMSVAAKGTRMDLGEFADTVKGNSVFLAGFGGTINKGAEEFAKTSKVMFDQYGETTDQLRNMGLTNKDLNDALALQAGMIGNSMRAGKERDAIAIQSATALATEMDLMAKMTGKSRQDQMESAKKLQADAAFQAKLEQQTRGMGEKEAAEYKTKIMAEYAKSEAIGMGQSFKETFTFGQVMTKAAANEMVIAGKAGTETVKAATAASAGNFEEAAKRNASAMEAAAAANKNGAFQNLVIMGSFSGAAGEAAQKQYMANKALADNIELLKKDPENKGKTDAELIALAKQKAKDEQDASSGSTKAMIQVEQRMKDVGSAIANGLVGPINKDVSPALTKLADGALSARSTLVPGARDTGSNNIAATEGKLLAGRAQVEAGQPIRGDAMTVAGAGVAKISKGFNQGAEKVIDTAQSTPSPLRRSEGTYGAGKMFEDVGSILEITKPGEVVLNGEQQMNLAKGMMDKGAAAAFNNLSKNLDFNKISQDIKTTISGGSSNTIKVPDINEMTKPFDKTFDEFGDLAGAIAKQQYDNMGEFAGVDEAVANQASMNDAVAASSPTATQSRGISMDSFTLGPNGLPIAKPKSTAAAVPEKKAESKTEAEQAEENRAKLKAKAAEQGVTLSESKERAPALDSKNATLDDVVKSLNSLNMQMGQLIEINESGHKSTAKAARSVSGNIYNK